MNHLWVTSGHSVHVPILGAHVPLLRALVLGQARVVQAAALPVRPQHADEVDRRGDHAEPDEADADGVARHVGRLVLGQEGVGGDDAAGVAEADLPRGADGAPVVAAEVHVEPADEQRQRRVCAAGDEEERAVLDRVGDGGQQDGEAGDGNAAAEHCEKVAVPHAVGDESDDHGEAERGGPGRDGVD